MALYYSAPTTPCPSATTGAVMYVTKMDANMNPLVGNAVYFQDPRVVADDQEEKPAPSRCARVTTLVLISLALTFALVTIALLALGLGQGWGDAGNDESTSRAVYQPITGCSAVGLVAEAMAVVTLVVCLVLTALSPRRVMASPTTHGMNCLCATIFLLAAFSIVSIVAFGLALQGALHKDVAVAGIALSSIATALKFAYFIDLVVVKCRKTH